MSAWVVVDTKITNPEAYEEYKALAGPMIQKYGGSYRARSEEHTSELQSRTNLVCRLLLEKKKTNTHQNILHNHQLLHSVSVC